jgi:hypothetical protein
MSPVFSPCVWRYTEGCQKGREGVVTRILVILLVLTTLSAQQPKTPTKPIAPGSLKGRAFAITKTGDVKPALLAHVYLFAADNPYNPLRTSLIKTHYQLEAKMSAAEDEYDAKARALGQAPGDRSTVDKIVADDCREALRHTTSRLPDENPVYTKETDETGAFEINRIRPGDYQLVVQGQAGSYDAVWIETVTIAAAAEKTVKLGTVSLACRVQ